MNPEQTRLDELLDLRSRITALRWTASRLSPAAAELLKAAATTLQKEAEEAHKVVTGEIQK